MWYNFLSFASKGQWGRPVITYVLQCTPGYIGGGFLILSSLGILGAINFECSSCSVLWIQLLYLMMNPYRIKLTWFHILQKAALPKILNWFIIVGTLHLQAMEWLLWLDANYVVSWTNSSWSTYLLSLCLSPGRSVIWRTSTGSSNLRFCFNDQEVYSETFSLTIMVVVNLHVSAAGGWD